MINAVEEYPGEIKKLKEYIELLEKEIQRLRNQIAELESQVFGGNTK